MIFKDYTSNCVIGLLIFCITSSISFLYSHLRLTTQLQYQINENDDHRNFMIFVLDFYIIKNNLIYFYTTNHLVIYLIIEIFLNNFSCLTNNIPVILINNKIIGKPNSGNDLSGE